MDPGKCPFCKPLANDIVARNELCYARWEKAPASQGHLLLMPYRHTPDVFSTTPEERLALISLLDECRTLIEKNYQPAGYNIGFNTCMTTGHSALHCHCHIIPRYSGAASEPKGIGKMVMGKLGIKKR
jgi:diadenosine tetraphosphate (Ap4A) HIT family hydrolase